MYILPYAACALAWLGLMNCHCEEGRKLVKLAAVLGLLALVFVGIGGGH